MLPDRFVPIKPGQSKRMTPDRFDPIKWKAGIPGPQIMVLRDAGASPETLFPHSLLDFKLKANMLKGTAVQYAKGHFNSWNCGTLLSCVPEVVLHPAPPEQKSYRLVLNLAKTAVTEWGPVPTPPRQHRKFAALARVRARTYLIGGRLNESKALFSLDRC